MKSKQTTKLESEIAAIEAAIIENQATICAALKDDNPDTASNALIKARASIEIFAAKKTRWQAALHQSNVQDALAAIKQAEADFLLARTAQHEGKARYAAEIEKTHDHRSAHMLMHDEKTFPTWLRDLRRARFTAHGKVMEAVRALQALDGTAALASGYSNLALGEAAMLEKERQKRAQARAEAGK